MCYSGRWSESLRYGGMKTREMVGILSSGFVLIISVAVGHM